MLQVDLVFYKTTSIARPKGSRLPLLYGNKRTITSVTLVFIHFIDFKTNLYNLLNNF